MNFLTFHTFHTFSIANWLPQTRKIIRQNMIWAFGYNVCALPLAAAGLVAPWLAAIGMSLSSLIVVLNALRLSRSNKGTPPPEATLGAPEAA